MSKKKDDCEFCGNIIDADFLEPANFSITGFYCIDCHKLCIEVSKDAIKIIRARTRGRRKPNRK
jgi:hypothetical protein